MAIGRNASPEETVMIVDRFWRLKSGSKALVRRIGPSRLVATIASASAGLADWAVRFSGRMMPALLMTTLIVGNSRCHLSRHGTDAFGVLDVEHDGLHPRIRRRHFVERSPPPAGNHDLVALLVKRLRQSASNPRATACDEDCVAGDVHGIDPFLLSKLQNDSSEALPPVSPSPKRA